MTTTIDNPYHVLGVKDNAGINEVTEAYKKLAKKYHPDLNPDDAVAAEAMKTINRAYDIIKSGYTIDNASGVKAEQDNSARTKSQTEHTDHADHNNSSNKNARSVNNKKTKTVSNEEKYINITKTSRILLNLIYSALLSGAAVYGIYALNNLLHTNATVLSEFSNGLSIYSCIRELTFEIVNLENVRDVLPLLFKNFNPDTFATVSSNFIFASMILFIVSLLVTVIYNVLYFACVKVMEKCTSSFKNGLTEAGALRSYKLHNKMKGTIRISNIVYAVFTYISLLIIELSVIMLTIMSGVGLACALFDGAEKINTVVIASKIFIIIGFILFIFVAAAFIVKKKERIDTFGQYASYENLGTYFTGIVIALIPILSIIAIAIAVLILIIRFLIWFVRGVAYLV